MKKQNFNIREYLKAPIEEQIEREKNRFFWTMQGLH